MLLKKFIGSSLFFVFLVLSSCGGSSNNAEPLTAGAAIVASNIGNTSMTLTWGAATSGATDQANLEYKLVYSTNNNISTAAEAAANGTIALDWTAGALTKTVTGLSASTTHYFNVLVKDATDTVAYVAVSESTTVNISCTGGLDCGGISCCATKHVSGGTFTMGANAGYPADTAPEHSITSESSNPDVFEVTVGRFRKFVDAYDAYIVTPTPEGAGANPNVAGTGWGPGWSAFLPASSAALKAGLNCDATKTWTDSAGANENKPINCITWYEAFLFCYWDGGRLLTEYEWEYSAAGGSEARTYPWGETAPAASFACYDKSETCSVDSYMANDVNKYGQYDLAGNVSEWVFDLYDASWYGACSGSGCVKITGAVNRVARGGSWLDSVAINLSSHYRYDFDPTTRYAVVGIRCTRD